MDIRELLIRILDEAGEKRGWHGANLRGSLRGVTAAQAAWKPAPDRPLRLLEVRGAAQADRAKRSSARRARFCSGMRG